MSALTAHQRTYITEVFPDADLTIIEEVLYFDGWQSYEECGGYLFFGV